MVAHQTEDDDGNAATKAAKPKAMDAQTLNLALNIVASAPNLDELKTSYTEAIKACGADDAAKAHVIAAKNQRKEELSK